MNSASVNNEHSGVKEKFLKQAVIALSLIHLVGVVGIAISLNTPELFSLSWVFVLFSLGLLALFHSPFRWNQLVPAIAIVAIGFFAEVIGVKTGVLFGHYYYGTSLGIKIFGVPLIIGLNWLMLTYATRILAQKLVSYRAMQVILGALLMVGYDFLLEIPAQRLNMWHWVKGAPDYHNFLGWLLVAAITHTVLANSELVFRNRLALPLFVIQLCFFGLLSATFMFM